MVSVNPNARYLPVVNHGGPMARHLGLVLHSQDGEGSRYDHYNDPTVERSVHFWVSRSGELEQFIDTDLVAGKRPTMATPTSWVNDYLSVEVEGFDIEPFTPAQVITLGRLYRWVHDTYGVPFATTDMPGQPGLGWQGTERVTILQVAAGAAIDHDPGVTRNVT